MPANKEAPPEVCQIAKRLVVELRTALGDRLLAVYLFGSATTGAFEPGISDVDMVAVLAGEPTDQEVSALASIHEQLAQSAPAWKDRIEVDYLSARALAEFRSRPWPAARISPGEPFHRIEIDHRWLLDWHQVRKNGVALYGPSPKELVPSVSEAEFVEAIVEQLREWPDRLSREPSGDGLAYGVLTVCRALRACSTGEYVSKKEAATWVSEQFPEFQAVIEDSVAWRYRAAPSPLRVPDRVAAHRLGELILRLCSRQLATRKT